MKNLIIRSGLEKDLPAILEIHNYFVKETAVTFEMEEATLENRLEWFGKFDETGPYQLLVAESEGELAGYATSGRFHERPAYAPSVMASVYLHPDKSGKGIGQELYRALLNSLEKTKKVHRAYGLVVLPNPASERLHLKFGFRDAGLLHEAGFKFDAYHSVRIYERLMD